MRDKPVISRIPNVRAGDIVELENDGLYWCYKVVTVGKRAPFDFALVPITEDERRQVKG